MKLQTFRLDAVLEKVGLNMKTVFANRACCRRSGVGLLMLGFGWPWVEVPGAGKRAT